MENKKEIWKKIENSKNYYVSNLGRIGRKDFTYWNEKNKSYSVREGKILTPNNTNSKSYYRIRIHYLDGTAKMEAIHRLVAKAFIPNPDNKEQVNHINGIKSDNTVTNLEWVTNEENMQHRYEVLKKFTHVSGEENNLSKLKEEQVKEIPSLLKQGMTKTAIAKKFGVGLTTICEITSGRSWCHLGLFKPVNKKSTKYDRY